MKDFIKNNNLNTDDIPDVFNNPFAMDCVESIFIGIRKKWGKETFCTYARVNFINGNTLGEQKFEDDDFQVVLKKVSTFITSLKN